MTMTAIVADDFNRANNEDIGAVWFSRNVADDVKFQLTSNAIDPDDLSRDCREMYDAIAWPNDQYFQAKLTATGTVGGGQGIGFSLRGSNSAKTYYRLATDHAASDNVEVSKFVAGAYTPLGTRTQAWSNGDTFKLEVENTTLRAYYNGTQMGADFSDAAISSGFPGPCYSSTITAASMDDMEAGGVITGPVLAVTGTWARLVVDGTVAIPSTPSLAGHRMVLWASWKDFAITVASITGWTAIGTEFADGAVVAGNGTGSVKVMCWYRDWQSGDAAPTIDWSANPTEGHAVIQIFQKPSDKSWSTPLTVTAAMTNWTTTSQTVAASATVAVPSDGVVMGLIGICDDSATMTRPTNGIDDSGGLITWNGNYVESPVTHFNSTTGLDMSGDLGHRLVTTGATATLRMTGTISAAETGAGKWVVQGVETLAVPAPPLPTNVNFAIARSFSY